MGRRLQTSARSYFKTVDSPSTRILGGNPLRFGILIANLDTSPVYAGWQEMTIHDQSILPVDAHSSYQVKWIEWFESIWGEWHFLSETGPRQIVVTEFFNLSSRV